MPALMAPPLTQVGDIQLQLTTHISTPKDDRLSWPGWLIYSGRFTHTSGHPSATGWVQDRESSPGQRPTFYHFATHMGTKRNVGNYYRPFCMTYLGAGHKWLYLNTDLVCVRCARWTSSTNAPVGCDWDDAAGGTWRHGQRLQLGDVLQRCSHGNAGLLLESMPQVHSLSAVHNTPLCCSGVAKSELSLPTVTKLLAESTKPVVLWPINARMITVQ